MPEWIDTLRRRVRHLFRREEFESDLSDEIQFHLDMQAKEYVRQGMPPNEAQREAKKAFGGVARVQEEVRSLRVIGWIESLVQDVRYGLGMLVRNPGFTLAAVLTLALGIGANTTVFGVLHAVLLRSLPYRDAERIVMLWQANPALGIEQDQVAPVDLHGWQQQSRSFERFGFLANDSPGTRNFLLERDDGVQRFRGRFASAGLFEVLDVAPLLGRTIHEDEYPLTGDRVAVLSHGFWQRAFGGDPQVLGRTLSVDGLRQQSCTVVGVMPSEFRFPEDCDAWFSFSAHPWHMPDRTVHDLWVIARLKPGVSRATAEAELNTLQKQLAESHPHAPSLATHVRVVPLVDQLVGTNTRPALLMLMAMVSVVLLIACGNVANLLLARAIARRKEIAVRIAMGAHRLRVIRQLLTESLLLSILGGGLGVLIAMAGIRYLPQMTVHTGGGIKEFRVDRFRELDVDQTVLWFTLAVSVATSFLFGLVPALQTSRLDLNASLKETGRSATDSSGRLRLKSTLLVGQMALTMILVVWAGLMIRGFLQTLEVPLGFRPEAVLSASADLDVARRRFSGNRQEITFQIMQRATAVPGVLSSAGIGELPTQRSGGSMVLFVQGQAPVAVGELPPLDSRVITPRYFETLGIPILKGRDVTEDDTLQSPMVVLINETAARRYFPNEDPLGKKIIVAHTGFPLAHQPFREIVGVVGDLRTFSQDEPVQPEAYHCYRQNQPNIWGGGEMALPMLFRTKGDPGHVANDLRRAIDGEPGSDRILSDLRGLQSIVDATAAPQRFRTLLSGFFSGLALVLAAIGIYGVMSYTVNQRIPELGIRLALGASRGDILRLVAGYGLKLTLLGVVLGLAGAVAGGRVLSSMFYGIPPHDPATLVVVTCVMVSVGVLASLVPAWRALRVEPMEVLRHE